MAARRDERDTAFEARDANARGVLLAGIALVGFVALSLGVLWVAQRGWVPERYSPAQIEAAPVAPPRLQRNPAQDLAAHEAGQQRILGEYRWLDPQDGAVRIPIRRAMQLLVERHGQDWQERP